MPFSTSRIRFAFSLLAIAGGAATALAQPVEQAPWFRLVDRPPADSGCRVYWQAAPLASVARRLRDACETTLWIDRRVDPTTLVTAGQTGGSLAESLRQVAESLGQQTTRLASTVYLGPDAATLPTRLANRLMEVDRLSRRQQRLLLARDAIKWPRLTEPRTLIVGTIEGHGLRVAGAERVPHDRWDAQHLPAAPFADQLTLLLAGFDLDWRFDTDRRSIVIVQAELPAPLVASHRASPDQRPAIEQQHATFSGAPELSFDGGSVTLRGMVEHHAALRDLLTERTKPSPADRSAISDDEDRWQNQRFTLAVVGQPAEPLLRGLAKQIGFSVELPSGAKQQLVAAGRIDLKVHNATLDELLQQYADAAGVSVTRRGDRVKVSSKRSN